MAEFQYRCPNCKATSITNDRENPPPCPVCKSPTQRQFVFQVRTSMPEHFNHSIGSYVTNEHQIKEALKVISEQQSHRNGIEHNFEYLSRSDLADASAHGVTDEGLEETQRATYVAD